MNAKELLITSILMYMVTDGCCVPSSQNCRNRCSGDLIQCQQMANDMAELYHCLLAEEKCVLACDDEILGSFR